jgi:hypothetical protein
VAPAWPEWRPLVAQLAPNISEDSFAPMLAGRLADISRAGVDAKQLLRAAVLEKPVPDDHAAAALWWRIYRHLNPALSAQINRPAVPTISWESRLAELIGTDRAQLIQTSPWWPALVTAVVARHSVPSRCVLARLVQRSHNRARCARQPSRVYVSRRLARLSASTVGCPRCPQVPAGTTQNSVDSVNCPKRFE